MFPKIGVPQNGLFIMDNPIKMDDFGGNTTIFGSTPISAKKKKTRMAHPGFPGWSLETTFPEDKYCIIDPFMEGEFTNETSLH